MLMPNLKTIVMLTAFAIVLGAGTACYKRLAGSDEPAKEAEIAACAGLSGQAKIECEARNRQQ
jgi:hypothetical protein